MVACHYPALFDCIVQKSKCRGRTGRAGVFKSHFRQDMRNRVPSCRCGSQAEIHNSEWNVQSSAGFPCNKLSDSCDLERRSFNCFGNYVKRLIPDGFESNFHDAGTGNADINRTFRFTGSAECAGHERIVFNCIGKNHEFGASESVGGSCCLSCPFDDLSHFTYSVHIDSCTSRRHVYTGAQQFRLAHNLRDGGKQSFIGFCCTFVHQCGKTAEKVDSDFFGGAVQRSCDRNGITLGNHADRSNADSFIDDRNAKFLFNLFSSMNQIPRCVTYFVIYPVCAAIRLRFGAVQKIDPQCDCTDIKIFFLNHPHRLEYFTCFNHGFSSSDTVHCVKNIHSLHMNGHLQFITYGLKFSVNLFKAQVGAIQVNNHHHCKITVKNCL